MNYDIKDLELKEELTLLGKTDDEFIQGFVKEAQDIHKLIKQYETMNEEQKEQVKHLLAGQVTDFYPNLLGTIAILAELSLNTVNYLAYLSEILHATESTKGAVKVEEHIKTIARILESLGYEVEDTVTQAHIAAQFVVKGGI